MGNTLSKTLAPAQRSRESEFPPTKRLSVVSSQQEKSRESEFPPTEEWNELALTQGIAHVLTLRRFK